MANATVEPPASVHDTMQRRNRSSQRDRALRDEQLRSRAATILANLGVDHRAAVDDGATERTMDRRLAKLGARASDPRTPVGMYRGAPVYSEEPTASRTPAAPGTPTLESRRQIGTYGGAPVYADDEAATPTHATAHPAGVADPADPADRFDTAATQRLVRAKRRRTDGGPTVAAASTTGRARPQVAGDDVADRIRRLKALHAEGLLDDAEYATKKAELVDLL